MQNKIVLANQPCIHPIDYTFKTVYHWIEPLKCLLDQTQTGLLLYLFQKQKWTTLPEAAFQLTIKLQNFTFWKKLTETCQFWINSPFLTKRSCPGMRWFFGRIKIIILQNTNGNTSIDHESHDQPPDVTIGANHEEIVGGSLRSMFFNDLLRK